MIGVPRNGKDIMDSINVYDKQYLISKICTVGTPEVEDSKKILEVYSMVGLSKSKFSGDYKRQFEDNIKINGVSLLKRLKKIILTKNQQNNLSFTG